MNYCKDAYKLFGVEVLCGRDCPIYKTCPWIICGDVADKSAQKIMKEMIKIANEKRKNVTRGMG